MNMFKAEIISKTLTPTYFFIQTELLTLYTRDN